MMGKTAHGWTILDAAKPVWCYQYGFANDASANCLVTRMPDEKLLVLSPAVNLPEGAFVDLAGVGEVGAVVATNGWHHLGLATWRDRYPDARFFASSASASRIQKKNPGAGELEPLSELRPMLGDNVILREVPAIKCGETWAILKVAPGYIWFASDTLVDLPTLPTRFLPRLMFKWTKSAPGFRVFHLWLRLNAEDKRTVLRALLEDLRRFPPRMVIPAHGEPVAQPDVASETRAIVRAAL
jgi:hypothetical protein